MERASGRKLRADAELEELRLRLQEAEQALEAIRAGQVDALVVEGPDGPRIFTLEGATQSYRVLVESMNEGAVTSSDDGTILYCNARFAQMVGAPLQQVVGGALRRHVPERALAALDALLERARHGGARDEVALRTTAGEELPVVLSASAIVDGGRRLFCLVATDLREQKRAEAVAAAEREARESEQRLREAARRKDDFLGMLSHELRNPLAPIRNSAYVLRLAEAGSEQARRAQQVIERQVEHLTRLVDDLLDVTRIARGRIELRRERVELGELVRRTAEDLRPTIEARGLTLRVVTPGEELWADADPTRITQVLGNLLQNAMKFSRSGDDVALSLAAAAAEAELRVRDTGAGIEPGLLPRLFEPFCQGERTLARSEGGLGLGLALVRGILELHGGTVGAVSAGTGQGSEFIVRLPLARPALARGDHPASAAPPATRHRILVVDDNVDAGESLAEVLRMLGHEVEVAPDGPSALEKVRRATPDVVLCDIGLPGMTGYDVASAIRSAAGRGPRLLALSGYTQPEDVRKAMEAGFDGYLTKPWDPEELVGLLG